jgi:hypothetical protein
MVSQDPSAYDLIAAAATGATKTSLWAFVITLPSIRIVASITLEISNSNYLQWSGMFSDVVEKYALEDHLIEKSLFYYFLNIYLEKCT